MEKAYLYWKGGYMILYRKLWIRYMVFAIEFAVAKCWNWAFFHHIHQNSLAVIMKKWELNKRIHRQRRAPHSFHRRRQLVVAFMLKMEELPFLCIIKYTTKLQNTGDARSAQLGQASWANQLMMIMASSRKGRTSYKFTKRQALLN